MIQAANDKKPTRRIFHPTDFSSGGVSAFVHALKITVQSNASLEILHVERPSEMASWEDFPHIRETLSKWGLIPEGAEPEDVGDLDIGVHKVLLGGDAPVEAILKHLQDDNTDLIVIAAHHLEGLDRWLHREIATRVARLSHRACLFVPHGIGGFVRGEDGTANIQRIVVPVASAPEAQLAIAEAWDLASILDCDLVDVTLLHVGANRDVFDNLMIPDLEGWTWELVLESGDPATEILNCADQRRANLIALTTDGRHGFLDALRGSTSERVVRLARCPVLSIPEYWYGDLGEW